MKELKKEDIKQEVFDLYDDYAHNKIDRRQFMDKLSMFAIGGITIPSLLKHVMPNYEQKLQVRKDDPNLNTQYITYYSEKGGGEIRSQLSFPKDAEGKLPAILVVHENRGLNSYIEDVGRRAAKAGFLSLSPDALWPLGGYPGNDDDGRAMQRKREKPEMLEDFIAGFEYLRDHPMSSGNVGVVGFCFGGWISNMLSVNVPDLKAAVPFYGTQPDVDLVPKIQAPLLFQFGELDKRVNAGWPAYEEALIKYKKDYQAYIYEGANHGFHNDTTSRYDEEDAALAWKRTIEFFEEKLK